MVQAITVTQVGKTERKGRDRETEFDIDITSYLTGGVAVTLPQLRLKTLRRLIIMSTELNFVARWDGSKTAPKILVLGDSGGAAGSALAEAADASDVGVFRVVAIGR